VVVTVFEALTRGPIRSAAMLVVVLSAAASILSGSPVHPAPQMALPMLAVDGKAWPGPAGAPPSEVVRPVDPRRAVMAAPWPLSAADTEFYDMVIMDDGYPGRRVGRRVVPHPLYANYVISGYLQLARDGDRRARAALSAMSHAVVNRMSPFRGTLVFWYTRDTFPLVHVGARGYSALTQARYADLLAQAAVLLRDRDLRAAAGKVFDSLLVPVAEGGVLRPGRLGPVLEEEPTAVPSAILNGWLSALLAVKSYGALTGSPQAAQLLQSSARELATRLPRYDLPAVLGSSYSAAATVSVRLDVPVGTTLRTATLVVDGTDIPLTLTREALTSEVVHVLGCGQRTREGIRSTCRQLRLDVPVTAGGIDPTSRVRLDLRGPGNAAVDATVRLGRYEYRHGTGRTLTGWGPAITVRSATSTAVVALTITPQRLREALNPTGFKSYGHRMVNGYHAIHIGRLRSLAAQGGPQFTYYAERWQQFRCGWTTHSAYASISRQDLAVTCPTAATGLGSR
jgi:hypothetical protein